MNGPAPPQGQDAGAAGQRQRRGLRANLAGLSAEARVAQVYERRGLTVAARRWRGAGAEIDLVVREGAGLVFVEVKQSRDFARAAERLGAAQRRRLCAAAEAFLAGEPRGQLTEVRFDVALVDGAGRLRLIENAFGPE